MPTSSAEKTAITPTREQDFPEWYQQVVRVAELAESSDVRQHADRPRQTTRNVFVRADYGFGVTECRIQLQHALMIFARAAFGRSDESAQPTATRLLDASSIGTIGDDDGDRGVQPPRFNGVDKGLEVGSPA